jgi:hypothetical protein
MVPLGSTKAECADGIHLAAEGQAFLAARLLPSVVVAAGR